MQQIFPKIIDYAIWYYLKYYPSVAKLKQKLKEKFGPKSENGKKYGGITDEEIDFIVLEKLQNIIQETEVIKAKIKFLRGKGKSKLYIKQKLYERQESKELIEQFLEEEFMEWEEETLKREYEKLKGKFEDRKIMEKLLRKGFSYDDVKKLKAEM